MDRWVARCLDAVVLITSLATAVEQTDPANAHVFLLCRDAVPDISVDCTDGSDRSAGHARIGFGDVKSTQTSGEGRTVLEGWTLTSSRIGGIVLGALVVYFVLKVALGRFFARAERGDADRVASLRQVAFSALRVVVIGVVALLILDMIGIQIGALIAALGVVGLAIAFGAQPLIRDIIGYISFVFADNFRAGEEVLMDGKRGELLKFEFRGVVLRVSDDKGGSLAYVPYSKIGTVENFDRAIEDA